MSDKLIILVGPTASGKTALSVQLADFFQGEIISGDSMQVYRYMDIGTAKITPREMQAASGREIPHYLIDILDPDGRWSVADFQQQARQLIRAVNAQGKIPLVVGGTGLYISSLLDSYCFDQSSCWDPEFRKLKKEQAALCGVASLYRELQELDPAVAGRLAPQDSHRIIRALEVWHTTGQSLLQWEQKQAAHPRMEYDVAILGLTMDRELLYQRINQRVDEMMERGLIAEVEKLLTLGYDESLHAMGSIGYRHILYYLQGLATKEEAVALLKRDTRRFAKRQMTWFKRDSRIKWLNMQDSQEQVLTTAITYIREQIKL